VPELTVKNTSSSLISLPVGRVPAKGVRSFNLDPSKLHQLKAILAPLQQAGHVEFWTDESVVGVTERLDDSLRGKAEALDGLHTRLLGIEALRSRLDLTVLDSENKAREIGALHDKAESIALLHEKALVVEALLAKAQQVDSLLSKSGQISEILFRALEIDAILTRLQEAESLYANLKQQVAEAQQQLQEIKDLRDQLLVRVETPLAEVRQDATSRLVSCSTKSPQLVPNLELEVDPGTWLATFEASMSSPLSASCVIRLMLDDAAVGQRATGVLHPEGNAPFVMTEVIKVLSPGVVTLTWQTDRDSVRMTERRLTLLKVSS